MPPKAAQSARGGAGRGRGAPRGAPRGGGPGPAPPAGGAGLPSTAAHVTTVGVKRTAWGTAGRPFSVVTNHFEVRIPEDIIHHYDVVISPSETTLPARLNMQLIDRLQTAIAPQVFTPRAVYDGRKNIFAARRLPFGPTDSQEFDVTLSDNVPAAGGNAPTRGPKVYKIRLTHVAQVNPEVLARFLEGKQSLDNTVLTAITALNVVIRMEPTLKYPFNVRSFFTNRETKDIGNGIELWRGYFQSVRPAVGKMLINVDISTGTMYKPGPLLNLCLDFLGKRDPNVLAPIRGFPDRERTRLQRFISGLRINTASPNSPQAGRGARAPRVVRKLTDAGANAISFTMREGGTMTVAQYFQRTYNYRLKFPDVICVEVGSGALIPLELCDVPPGQLMRKQVPPEKTKDVLDFATKRPQDRLGSICAGLGVLAYGQSEYVRQFGLHVDADAKPLSFNARVLAPPDLKYGPGSKQPIIRPANGAWNMIDKKFFQASKIERWVVVVYEREQRFNMQIAREMVQGLLTACREVGIAVREQDPLIRYENPQGRISDQMRAAGAACSQKSGGIPELVVVVLPDNAADIYQAVKHFGDVTAGVATQCLKSQKCSRAKAQYYANVCLKINVKLGGINTIPEPRSVSILTDPHNPTIVMGADVMHPAPGSDGRPSFTALVANVDSDTAKYIADCRVQTSRRELIEDLESMAERMLTMYMQYRKAVEKKSNVAPKRIIFYRDGVSEGQFSQVLEFELPMLQNACKKLQIKPTITMIVVGKRHHVRFFPRNPNEGDRSGNCPAGTVVDREVVHPLDSDFYLQSHAGLLGTSRPAHYSLLYDENNLTADGVQALSFALCHVYARSTRSVSIPAPVYYADIVCARAKNHYDPQGGLDLSDSATRDESAANKELEDFRKAFKPLHQRMARVMYFS